MAKADDLLTSIRRACRSIISQAEINRQHHERRNNLEAEAAYELAEKIQWLDDLLSNGGNLPVDWSDPQV